MPLNEGLKYLGVGRTKAYELITEGKVQIIKMGSHTLIDLDTVDAFHAALPPLPKTKSTQVK